MVRPGTMPVVRSNVGLFVVLLTVLVCSTWAAVKITTDRLLYQNATTAARDWARYLGDNVADLEQIASGQQPSEASTAFFRATGKPGQVYRYEIFNRFGYSQLVSDHGRMSLSDVSELDAEAARSVTSGRAVVDAKAGQRDDQPSFYATAYVPVTVDGRAVAIVAAYIDQTEQRDNFYQAFLIAAAVLGLTTGFSFLVPAIAWLRRTREKQHADRRLRFLAHHDALTGLTSRAHLFDQLELAFASGRPFAVHYIDLDRFKEVNDTLGHDGGDFLLTNVADRLRANTRPLDVTARLGGDEFVVLQADIEDTDEVRDFALRLVAAIKAPMVFNEQEIVATVSVGVAMAPINATDPAQLLKCADLALYKSKADGRNCVRFFEPALDAAQHNKLAMEKVVREAVAEERFVLHYQPLFELAGRRLIGFEALIRMTDKDGGLVSPAVFIPIAENLRLIDRIGAWALQEACRTAATWPPHLTVAVNLSPAQFGAGQVAAVVADALERAQLAPRRLELEITETLLLGTGVNIMEELQDLKALGCCVVIDDFGIGYSSLSYLWLFPFDKIKIDRSFMHGTGISGGHAETVVKTIITLACELKMRVTVEGVETARQLAFLDTADADQVQGYHFGYPMPSEDVPAAILANIKADLDRNRTTLMEPRRRAVGVY